MSEHYQDLVRSILLPSEELKVTLEALTLPTSNDDSPVLVQDRNKRILAVVLRVHTSETNEQGWLVTSTSYYLFQALTRCKSLFIFKPKIARNGSVSDLLVEHVIPVVGDFSISMAQSRRNTIDLRNATPALTLNQPRTGMF